MKQPQNEDQLQALCYQTAYNTYPQIRGFLFSVPNGSQRSMIEAQKLKATGQTPGIPDLLLVWPQFHAFELKTPTGRKSEAQIKIHAKWRSKGIPVHEIKSLEQFMSIIREILK